MTTPPPPYRRTPPARYAAKASSASEVKSMRWAPPPSSSSSPRWALQCTRRRRADHGPHAASTGNPTTQSEATRSLLEISSRKRPKTPAWTPTDTPPSGHRTGLQSGTEAPSAALTLELAVEPSLARDVEGRTLGGCGAASKQRTPECAQGEDGLAGRGPGHREVTPTRQPRALWSLLGVEGERDEAERREHQGCRARENSHAGSDVRISARWAAHCIVAPLRRK